MKCKQLYNINKDVLISLYPKDLVLEVKKDFSTAYHLDKTNFTILYALAISHPHVVTYEEISKILDSVDIELKEFDELNKQVQFLKKELTTFGVNKLIISIKGIGYAISNKWVEPNSITHKAPRRNFLNSFRKIYGLAVNRN